MALFSSALSAAPLKDDDGTLIDIDAGLPRVITLAPHLAELVFAVGAGEQLVGTIEWSNYPDAALEVPRVGDAFRVDYERVIELQPDIVLAWGGGTPIAVIDKLREYGLVVAVIRPTTLESIAGHIRWIGKVLGHAGQGEQEARDFERTLAGLRRQYSGKTEISVFYQVSARPLYTLNGTHPISELIKICSGRNIFSDLDQLAPAVTVEAVLARNPEAIVAGRYAEGDGGLDMWKEWQDLAAVRFDNLLAVDAEKLARSTPRILEGGKDLCHELETARARLE